MRTFAPIAITFALGALVGCATMDKDPVSHDANAIKVGLQLPITGPIGALAKGEENGARLAVAEINAAGGVNGKPLDLYLRDDKLDTTIGLMQAKDLAAQGMVAIVGPATSGVSYKVVTEFTDAAGIPLVSPSATSPLLTGSAAHGTFFRTAPSDAFQGVVLASEVYASGIKDIGVIYVDNSYGAGLSAAFKAKYQALGGTIRSFVPYADGKTLGFSGEVGELLASGVPAGVLLIGYTVDAANITRDIQQANPLPRPKVFGAEGLFDTAFLANAAADIVEGMMGTVNVPPTGESAYQGYAARYKARTGEDPFVFSESAYDAIYLVALSMQAGGANTREAVLANLRQVSSPSGTPASDVIVGPYEWAKALDAIKAGKHVNYDGASGRIDWDAKGDVTSGTYNIYKVVKTGGQLGYQIVKTITYP